MTAATMTPVIELLGTPDESWEYHAADGGGMRYVYPNWYGLSVICHSMSYGWEICYDTGLHGEDLPGWLSAAEVAEYAERIKALPAVTP